MKNVMDFGLGERYFGGLREELTLDVKIKS